MLGQNPIEFFEGIAELTETATPASSSQGRILVVDDEIDTSTPLCEIFTKWGYEVVCYTSGKYSLEAIKKQDFDVLMTDLTMPEMNGIELTKAAIEISPVLVCIIMTGYGTIQTAVEAMKSGAFDYVLKPLDFKILAPILSRAMEVSRLRKTEEKYRSLFENASEGIYQMTPDGRYISANRALARILGYKTPKGMMNDLNQKKHQLYVEPARYGEIIRLMKECGEVSRFDSQVFRQDGSKIWISENVIAVCDPGKRFLYYRGTVEDITESKRAQEALLKSEKELKKRVEELEDYYDIAVRRELKMHELKDEIESLKEELKKYKAYDNQSFYYHEP